MTENASSSAAAGGRREDNAVTRFDLPGRSPGAPAETSWPPAVADALPGSTLGGFEVVELIGRGGMGTVYKARQASLDRLVALKVLGDDHAASRSFVDRFSREARAAAAVVHPNIIEVYDVGQDRGRWYLAMELVDGESLAAVLQRGERLSPQQVVDYLRQTAAALAKAHAAGILHRDIKPGNLLVTRDGVVKVVDFGLAKRLDVDVTVTAAGQLMGTPLYMPPELTRGQETDERSDLYSLGATFYHLLAGQPPFAGSNIAEIVASFRDGPAPSLQEAAPDAPGALCRVLQRLLHRDPADRFTSPAELLKALRAVSTSPDSNAAEREVGQHFDDRASFAVARAALAVVCRRCEQFADENAVWEEFIHRQGRGDVEYLRRIRAGGKVVFYAILQSLYEFAEDVCGEDVCLEVGHRLARMLLEQHMPDLLHSMLAEAGTVPAQMVWLIEQFLAGASVNIYSFTTDDGEGQGPVRGSLRYRSEERMCDYLKRSGLNPQRAFGRGFRVFTGAVQGILQEIVQGFAPEQCHTELRSMEGTFVFDLYAEDRFQYESIIDILLDFVRRLRHRDEAPAPSPETQASRYPSPAMRRAWEWLRKAAACDETVLLCGESGTGKSYHAARIHEMSPRSNGPFVEVGLTADVGSDSLIQSNLFGHVRGAYTDAQEEKQGLFSLADGGTIFLDEIGDASEQLQAKLLRVIDSKRFRKLGGLQDVSVDVRIITATNKDLAALVRQGAFREDLFHRLNVIPIVLPPLRDRAEDLPALAQMLFERVCRDAGKEGKRLAASAAQGLTKHHWPGNIRELENTIRRAVAFSDQDEVVLDHPGTGSAPLVAKPIDAILSEPSTDVLNRDAIRQAYIDGPPPDDTESYQWPGHIDYVRRECLLLLIEHYNGDLREIARHWDRSSENTLRKLIRQFGLEDRLRQARKSRP